MCDCDRTWTLTDASRICHMSKYGLRKQLDKKHVRPVADGTTRNGGCRYSEKDLVAVFGARFKVDETEFALFSRCQICGKASKNEQYDKTHGLCLECWCKALNKHLIDERMKYKEAVAATLKDLNSGTEHHG